MNQSLALKIEDPGQAGEARRNVAEWGRLQGWDEEMGGRVALIITELGNNLAIHTAGGMLLLRGLSRGSAIGVEFLSLDSGPGMANFSECLRDGFSTAGTSGNGLGAVKRASDAFQTHSQPGIGTALLGEVWPRSAGARAGSGWQTGAVNVAMGQEFLCGDSWAQHDAVEGITRIMIADGLGHGEQAAHASQKAVEVFLHHPGAELTELLTRMHEALRSTRGAAVAIAEVDISRKLVNYAGVGNISATIVTHGASTSLVSMNGTVGVQLRGIKTFEYQWPEGGVLIMLSDGIKSQWQLDRYAGLLDRHPGLIAGVIYRDYSRGSDDATVVALRRAP